MKKVDADESTSEEFGRINNVNIINGPQPFLHRFYINGSEVVLEIDSGAAASLLSETCFNKFGVLLSEASMQLHSYGSVAIPVLGEAKLDVVYGPKRVMHNFFIIKGNSDNLCGRDLMEKLGFKLKGTSKELRVIKKVITTHELIENYEVKKGAPIRGFKAQISLKENAVPKVFKARKVPAAYEPLVKEALNDMVKQGYIEAIKYSNYAAPIVPVLKKNGSMRICADFKYLNSQLNIEKYPLPTLEEILSLVGANTVFGKLDLENAYAQVCIEDYQNLLVITTPQGLYKYLRLPYGLASSPGIFQRYVSQLLANVEGVKVFLDDILICANSKAQFRERLIQVLSILKAENVSLNKTKCETEKDSLEFLGYVISKDGLKASQNKVKAMVEAPEPTNLTELRSFIGMVTYYSRFIPNFATVMAPLYELTKKGVDFAWSEHCVRAFHKIKDLLGKSQALTAFTGHHKLILETDGSPIGAGAVLLQVENGIEKPIAFASRKLSGAELNYSQIDREALSAVFGCLKFKYFLLGRNFDLRVDHKPLLGLFGKGKRVPVNANARVQRWALLLSQFSYDMYHKSGASNVVADMLSRLPIKDGPVVPTPIEYIKLIDTVDSVVSFKNLQKESINDPEINSLMKKLRFGWKTGSGDCREFAPYKHDLSLYNGVVLYNNRVLVPANLRKNTLKVLHMGHNGIVAMKVEARTRVWWPGINQDIEEVTKGCPECSGNFKSKPGQYMSWPFPRKPWSRLAIDYCGPIDGKMFLIIVDAYTKFIDVHYTKSATSLATIECLRKSFANFGIPDVIVSDNASYFVSEEIKQFYARNGIRLVNPAPFNPSSNGLAERGVRTFKEGLKKFAKGSLNTRVSKFLYHYRRATYSVTKVSPAQLMFNRAFKFPLVSRLNIPGWRRSISRMLKRI